MSGEYLSSYVESWAKRLVLYGTLAAALVGGTVTVGSLLGFRVFGPQNAGAQVKALEDSIGAHNKRITSLEHLMEQNVYISCKVLERVQPPLAIPPQECSTHTAPP